MIAVAADVSNEAAVESAVKEATKGLGHLDILVNNAGIDTTSLVADMPTAMWDEMMAINLRSVFPCTRAVLPGMIARKFGRIISTSSQLAHKGAPEMAHYAAAKAGVIGFTRSLAYEVARDGVTVNAICPGPIDTELFRGIRRRGESGSSRSCQSAAPAPSKRSRRPPFSSPRTRAPTMWARRSIRTAGTSWCEA